MHSGVVLATAYTLFDNNYMLTIARNATLEAPPSAKSASIQSSLMDVFEKMPARIIQV